LKTFIFVTLYNFAIPSAHCCKPHAHIIHWSCDWMGLGRSTPFWYAFSLIQVMC